MRDKHKKKILENQTLSKHSIFSNNADAELEHQCNSLGRNKSKTKSNL